MHQLWHDLTHPWPIAILSAMTSVLIVLRTWALIRDIREARRLARYEDACRLASEAFEREPQPAYHAPSPAELALRDADMVASGWTKDTLFPGVWTKPVPRPMRRVGPTPPH